MTCPDQVSSGGHLGDSRLRQCIETLVSTNDLFSVTVSPSNKDQAPTFSFLKKNCIQEWLSTEALSVVDLTAGRQELAFDSLLC